MNRKPLLLLLNNAPIVLFALVLAVFGLMSGKFLDPKNLLNIVIQSSAVGIVAVGMTFVLLTAGVDLAVGSVMFVAVAVAGKLIFQAQSVWVGFLAAMGVGLIFGMLNALFITRLKIIPFIDEVTPSWIFLLPMGLNQMKPKNS